MNEKTLPSTRFDSFTYAREQRKASRAVPAVRFKADDGSEFPEWEEKKLGDLCSYVHRRGQAGNYVGTENLLQNFGGIRQLGADQKKEGILYSKGDILFSNIRPYLKKTWLADRSGTCSSDVLVFRSTTVLPGYLYSLIASDRFIGEVMGSAKGSKMPRGDKQAILQIPSAVPSLPEQNKIASLLSSIDSTLTLCQRKLDLLTQAKKAWMQQIFSQKLRFKADDGSEFPAWEEKKIGDIATFFNGRAFSQEELQNKGKYKVLRVGNLFSNANYYYSDLELEENKYITNGDLIYAWSATFGPQIYEGEKCIYHYHIWKVEPSLTKVSRDYLYFLLQHDVSGLESMLNGGTMLHITKQTMESRLCMVPSLPEQQKIAACLSSADALIDQARVELEQWQEVKKSLLQQLFV